jgi:hypothetical protein
LVSDDRGLTWQAIARPVRYEDMRDVFRFQGQWEQNKSDSYSAMTESVTSTAGSSVRLRFVGSGVRWLGSKGPDYGWAQVLIDGELVATIHCNATRDLSLQEIFVTRSLSYGSHEIEIRALPDAADARQGLVGIDALDILTTDQDGH